MSRGVLQRRLARRPRLQAMCGAVISLFFVAALFLLLFLLLWEARRGAIKRNEFLSILILAATGSALGLLLTGWAAVEMGRVYDYRHKDLRALGRYGPPPEVAAAIDAEVLGGRRLARLGTLQTYLSPVPDPGGMYGHQVLLTETWLLDFYRYEGDRFNALRLPDLVWASQGSARRRAKLILIDRHDTRLEIFGTPTAVSRLLAEVLARVPWVLERFDPEAERAWGQDRTGILADVDRRREQFRLSDNQPDAPTTPA